MFAERGYHGASLDEVAAVAGFSKGAVYSNFKNKEDLFLALLESHYEREMAAVRATLEATDGPPEAHLSNFVALIREQFQRATGDNWAMLYEEFFLYAMRNPTARERLAAFDTLDVDSVAEIIEGERDRHGIDLEDPPEHVARIVIALMRGISMMRNLDPDAVDEPFLESVMAFLIRAMT